MRQPHTARAGTLLIYRAEPSTKQAPGKSLNCPLTRLTAGHVAGAAYVVILKSGEGWESRGH